MTILDRTLIEKLGYDNGWENAGRIADDAVALSSSLHPFTVAIGIPPDAKEWHLQFSEEFPVEELKREFPAKMFEANRIVVWSKDILADLLRVASRLGRVLPDQPVGAYQKLIAEELNRNPGIKGTEAEQLVKVRIGQEVFRSALDTYWKGCCAVTGLSVRDALRASHAKPWAVCDTATERLSVFNGLLLCANLDALFDKGLISFDKAGQVMISSQVEPSQWRALGIDASNRLRWIADRHQPFLEWHRKNLFRV